MRWSWGTDEEVCGDAGEEAGVNIEEDARDDTTVTADEGGVEDVEDEE